MRLWKIDHLSLAERQLHEFRKLPEGWKYGEGGPINEMQIDRALAFLRHLELHGFRKVRAFAASDRSVMLNAVHGEDSLELIFETDGTFSLVHDEGGEEVDRVEHVDWRSVRDAIGRAVRRIWPSFDSSTRATTTPTLKGSHRSHTRTYAAVCQSS